MTSTEFIELLEKYYIYPEHEIWRNYIKSAVKKVVPYLEDNFLNNHFSHFHYQEERIRYDVLHKYFEGMWHLHVANLLLEAGYALKKPIINNDDIIALYQGNKIYIECTCPHWGREQQFIRNAFKEMSSGMTDITDLHVNFIDKLVYVLKEKEKKILQRKKNIPGTYILAINEGFLVNGFQEWDGKYPADRLKKVLNAITGNRVLDGILYGCVFESGYCQLPGGFLKMERFT